MDLPINHVSTTKPESNLGEAELRHMAVELEANFLSEMLKSAGVGKAPDGFDGGTGEDQFASFLRLEQARAMAGAGGIGLAEILFHALKEKNNAT